MELQLRDKNMTLSSILPTYNRAPLSFVKGEGAWLMEADGRRFLDFGAGIAVNTLGHANPDLAAALKSQADTLWHVSNLYEIPGQRALADKLTELTFADYAFFTNSGTEACELTVKMVRKYWHDKGQPEKVDIITFDGCFHGRSTAAIAASGAAKMIEGFGPTLEGFTHLSFGAWDDVANHISDTTAAIMTGKLFAHEHAGVTPDIMMVAKGIGGGFPLGAVLATKEAALGMVAGTHGSTYGGNPLGAAVGLKVLEIVTGDGFLADVSARASQMQAGLEGLKSQFPTLIEDVRGRGLMLGLKLSVPPIDVVTKAYEAELLTVPAADNTVRLLPPLNVTESDIKEALARLATAFNAVQSEL